MASIVYEREISVADTNVSPFAPARNICCGHKFCVRDTKNVSATNVSQFAQPKKHHGQHCVCNNVSSFTRACSGGGVVVMVMVVGVLVVVELLLTSSK